MDWRFPLPVSKGAFRRSFPKWEVLDTEGGVEKAIRIIKTPLKSEEAQAELKAPASYKNLRHPFLLHTDSAFEVEQHLVIVMELVEGGSLRDRLKELRRAGEKGMAPFPLLGHISEVAQVLDSLHGKNILHRDIKPNNILLGKERYQRSPTWASSSWPKPMPTPARSSALRPI